MKKYLPFIVIIAVLTVVVGLVVNQVAQGVIRDALVRVYQAVYAAASAIPQPYYWAFLILVILVNAVRSITSEGGPSPSPELPTAGGRAAEWREWLERAAHPTSYRLFYRWLVARNLARLASEVVAHEKGVPPGEAEREIEDGDIPLPPAIRDYFVASLRSRPTRHESRRGHLLDAQPPGPLDLDPAQAVELIETQMEVPHGNRNP